MNPPKGTTMEPGILQKERRGNVTQEALGQREPSLSGLRARPARLRPAPRGSICEV